MTFTRPVLTACLVALPSLALGQMDDHSHHHVDELGAHEHGVGALNIAVEGEALEIELAGPADNFLGFEHTPGNEAERERARSVLASLRQSGQLFKLPKAAGCEPVSSAVHSDLLAALDNPEHASAEAEHQNHHDHAHATHDHHAEAAAPAHQDIAAHYRFRCDDNEALDQIELTLFKLFPNTERLLVQSVGTQQQLGTEVTASQPVLNLR